ncbi:MAG: glycoside hydrolase family 3 N-terminal domain-containing protein [Anaerolineae bacterium]
MYSFGQIDRVRGGSLSLRLRTGRWIARLAGSLLLILFLPLLMCGRGVQAQEEDPRVNQVIEKMSVEERVGQLFLVTFVGADAGPDSDITRLIEEYKVGGVLVSPGNGNFTNAPDAPIQVAKLSEQLQSLALADEGSGVPLFIAIESDGDGAPATWLRAGMTAVPSPLALGATWLPANAEVVGQIVGGELSAVGVNLLLGPPLDVLLTPRPGQPGDLKTRSFGGSPFWVGQMGRAYIQGVHEGSAGRVATVAKHFPGHGSSDRSPDEEAATVEKPLDEMLRTDLVPFLTVTNVSDNEQTGMTDALTTSHLRYRGFQGPTRTGSPPLSFDPGGLKVVMDLPQLEPWRERGLLVSESLGVPAVRRHFSPELDSFPHKEIAQKALLAGNDLLLVSRFALQDDDWPSQFDNITSAIAFFREKYESDDTFQARVDEALSRILRLKLKLYPSFHPNVVKADPAAVSELVAQPKAKSQVAAIAQSAVAVVAPSLQELADRLPAAPRFEDSILIFTETRLDSDCPDCESYQLLSETAIEEAILRLYGPDATGQIDPDNVHSFTYQDLKALASLPGHEEEAVPTPTPTLSDEDRQRLEGLLEEADWILFAMHDIDPEMEPASDALRIFLKEQFSSLADKKAIVLAYGAPYYLDATEISKLTAYYAIFSKIPASIEGSVRALFQEFTPTRALPVSVPSITYDLTVQLEPDPAQVLTVDRVDTEDTIVNVGQEFEIQTSPILDRNGHPVPDGTKVTLWLTDPTDSTYRNLKEIRTIGGVARAKLLAERAGAVEISAEAGEAQTTESLALTVKGEEEPPTATSEPPTITPTLEPTNTPVPPSPVPQIIEPEPPAPPPVGWGSLGLSVLGMFIAGILAMILANSADRALAQTTRLFMLCLAAGLGGYVIVGLKWLQIENLPGLSAFPRQWQTPMVTTLLALTPLIWVVWDRRQREL